MDYQKKQQQSYPPKYYHSQAYKMIASASGEKTLKVTGILMIIFGAISLVGAFSGISIFSMSDEILDQVGYGFLVDGSISEFLLILIYLFFATYTVYNIMMITTGIVGISLRKRLYKNNVCIVMNVILLILLVVSSVVLPMYIASTDERNSLLIMYGINSLMGVDEVYINIVALRAILSVLSIIGIIKNKKSAKIGSDFI